MHVVFVANCERAALGRTRTLLDRYAQRIGDRAWATLITRDALDEMHKALRRQASRHTSVACYRSDAVFGLRLEWIVGNQDSYDGHERFAVATERRKKPFALPFRHAALIAQLAGYVHDFGKASRRFQEKLKTSQNGYGGASQRDAIRHEWLSAWLMRFLMEREPATADPTTLAAAWNEMRCREGTPGGPLDKDRTPLASGLKTAVDAMLWAVCTHHGAMGGSLTSDKGADGSLHVRNDQPVLENITLAHNEAFGPRSAPKDCERWSNLFKAINKMASRIREIERSDPYWEGVMLMARAALIFADHKVSSERFDETRDGVREAGILFANTKQNAKLVPDSAGPALSIRKRAQRRGEPPLPTRTLDQPLSWHLQQVGDRAGNNIRILAGDGLPCVDRDLVRQVLERRADPASAFIWQDQAVDHLGGLEGGKLVFNVASTGAGKTFANLKMAFGMRPDATRLAVAFNLRSLTTQTFAAFRTHVTRGDAADAFDRDFACLLGERGEIPLDFSRQDEDDVDREDELDLEGAKELSLPSWLSHIAHSRQEREKPDEGLAKLIATPVLVSTMDWIVAAGEPGQQARHAKAFIRVANSDLILDEVDSYDVKATVAVMRVVQMAASFGRHVIVSSATLSPELAQGLCIAYDRGRRVHDALFGAQPWHLTLVSDRFPTVSRKNPEEAAADAFYRDTMQEMARNLSQERPTKRYRIIPVDSATSFTASIAEQAMRLHESQANTPPGLRCRLSIGLVRIANIKPCRETAEFLRNDGRFVVTAYHAQDVAQRRVRKEYWLDRILMRSNSRWVDALCDACPWIRNAEGDVRLIVVATPVEEVGRDHDFDWAIIEPSSMHSIIQAAGRVNRHRRLPLEEGRANIGLLSRNWRSLNGKNPVFTLPGLESKDEDAQSTHPCHDLHDLMRPVLGGPPDTRLDAGLVFDAGGRQTAFSEYDERAVKLQVKNSVRIIKRDPGFETHFMMQKFATEFPLREKEQRLDFLIDFNGSTFCHALDPQTPSGNVVVMNTPSNVWLTPGWDEIVTPEKRLSVTIRDSDVQPTQMELHWNGVVLR